MTETARRVYQIEVDASKALRTLGRIDKNTDRIARGFERTREQASRLGRTLRNVFVGGALFAAFRNLTTGLTRFSDAAQDLQARLSASAGGPAQAAAVFQDLFDVAQRLGAPIESLGQSFQRLSIAIPGAALSDLVFGLETITQVLATTGASTQATNAVLLQLSQGFGAGVLRGDEFRSVLENAPVLLRAWANAAGETDRSLRELRDASFFTTESFIENNAQIREIAEELIGLSEPAATVQRSFQRIRNAITAGFFQAGGATQTPFTALAEQLDRIATLIGPAVFIVLQNVSSVFDALFTSVSGLASALPDISDLFSGLRSELETVRGELGFFGFLFGVVLPTAISKFPDVVTTVFRSVGIQAAIFVNQLENVFRSLALGLNDVFTDIGNSLIGSFESAINLLIAGANRVRSVFNLELLEEVSIGRVSGLDLSSIEDEFAESTRAIEFLRDERDQLIADLDKAINTEFLTREGQALGLVTEGLKVNTQARGALTKAVQDEDAAKKAKAARDREEAELLRLTNRLIEEEARLIAQINREQRDFTDSLEDEIKALDDRLLLLSAPEADRARIADALEIENRLQKLNTDILRENNEQRRQSLIIRRDALRAATPGILGRQAAIRDLESRQAGTESGGAFAEGFEVAADGIKDIFSDIFKNGLDEARSFSESLRDILSNTVDAILDSLIDTFVDQLTRGVQQGIGGLAGGGGSGGGGLLGGGGGILNALFGGGGGGGGLPVGAGAATGPELFSGGGGGGFNLGGLASPLGFLAGGLLASVFDSKSSVRETSPLELDPLPDVFTGQPNFTIVNNGQPLQVDGVSRTNGDYQLIVSAAVSETRSVYERDLRRGYGGFSEALRGNTTADNSV